MAAVRSCAVCGGSLQGKQATAKTCGPRCRQQARRTGGTKAPAVVRVETDLPPLVVAVFRELADAGRHETALGQAALALADKASGNRLDTGSAVASLIRELRATLAEALKGADVAEDPLDMLRERRDRKRRTG